MGTMHYNEEFYRYEVFERVILYEYESDPEDHVPKEHHNVDKVNWKREGF